MENLYSRLDTLNKSLEPFKPTDSAQWPLAQMFNALLEQVKAAHGDDPVVKVISPAEESSMSSNSTMQVGVMRAAVAQLMDVVYDAQQ
jgi:hypothetical protein